MKEKNKILAPYVAIGYKHGILNLGYGSINTPISNLELQNAIIEICAFFKKPHLLTDYSTDKYSKEMVDTAFRILIEGHYIVDYDSLNGLEKVTGRLDLYLLSKGLDPEMKRSELHKKKITIVGCGAIGTETALLLSTLGIKQFLFADYDQYDAVNVGRCANITAEMIGQNKAVGLSKLIKRKMPDINCKIINKRITAENVKELFVCDLLILSADAIYMLEMINSMAIKFKIPFIQIGYSHDLAVWGPFVIPDYSACIMCRRKNIKCTVLNPHQISLCQTINTGYISPAPAHIVQLAVSLGVNDIFRYFLGEIPKSLNKQLAFSPETLDVQSVLYEKANNCDVCGKI